ncbi:MAG: hypothetical protein IIX46_05735 [Bacteroidaceae bacterium]|nr:hypothetical protein [Bacteroidaceae bacterium]
MVDISAWHKHTFLPTFLHAMLGITSVIQSSSATTVMVVSFVNASIHATFLSSRGPTREFPVLSLRSSGGLGFALVRPRPGPRERHLGII